MVHNITINKRQASMLRDVLDNFGDVEFFELEQEESGTLDVRFSMFGDYSEPETTVQISEDYAY